MTTGNTRFDVQTITDQIVRLPRYFRDRGNISFCDLLRQSGYHEIHENVSETLIASALTHCRDCISEWMQYAADKRTRGGWYLAEAGSGRYEVGCFEGGAPERRTYADVITATSVFIKREIEFVRQTP